MAEYELSNADASLRSNPLTAEQAFAKAALDSQAALDDTKSKLDDTQPKTDDTKSEPGIVYSDTDDTKSKPDDKKSKPDPDSIEVLAPTAVKIARVATWTPAGQWSLLGGILLVSTGIGLGCWWFFGRTVSASPTTTATPVGLKAPAPGHETNDVKTPKERHGQPTLVPSRCYGDPGKAKNNKEAITFVFSLSGDPVDLDKVLAKMGVAVVGAEDAYMRTVQWPNTDVDVHVEADPKQQHAIWGAMLNACDASKHRVDVTPLGGDYAQSFLDWLWEHR